MSPKRFLLLVLAAAAVAPAARAQEPDPKASIGFLDIRSTAIPVIWQGRLVNYIFVKARLTLAPGANSTDYRAKLPYVRDALVRDSHKLSLVRPGEFMRLDEAAFTRTVFAEANRFLGPRVVTAVTVTSQSPARTTGFPKRSPSTRTLIP